MPRGRILPFVPDDAVAYFTASKSPGAVGTIRCDLCRWTCEVVEQSPDLDAIVDAHIVESHGYWGPIYHEPWDRSRPLKDGFDTPDIVFCNNYPLSAGP